MKSMSTKKPAKDLRERWVLLGLVDLYIKTGRPIGSNTLRENGFDSLSSATIRNYFSKLEEQHLLSQQHTSGGRIPTELGFRLYAETCLQEQDYLDEIDEQSRLFLESQLKKETRHVVHYLQEAAEVLSELSGCPVIVSAPRFDQDFITAVRIVPIDEVRCLAIIRTDFGMVHTEVIYADQRISEEEATHLSHYFLGRLTGKHPTPLSAELETFGNRLYNEVLLRHIVSYNHFSSADLYRTGLSKLLQYPELSDAATLASALGIFENEESLRALLKNLLREVVESAVTPKIRYWIGEDLLHGGMPSQSRSKKGICDLAGDFFPCSILAIPYCIQSSPVGSLALLGPTRIDYKKLFGILEIASKEISMTLTASLYKYKLAYRTPQEEMKVSQPSLKLSDARLLEERRGLL